MHIDSQGLQRLADDRQVELEQLKLECQRKSDVGQSIDLERQDKEREADRAREELRQLQAHNEVLSTQNATKGSKADALQRDNAHLAHEIERLA